MFLFDAGSFLGGNSFTSPLDLSGLTLWLDAADSATITQSSNLVSNWANKAGNALLDFAGSSTTRPVTNTRTINSKNVLDFDGSDDKLVCTGAQLSDVLTNSAFTGFIVASVDSFAGTGTGVNNQPLFIDDTGGALGIGMSTSNSNQIYINNDDGSADAVAKTTLSTSTPYIVMTRHESGSIYISVNGGAESSTASGNTTPMTGTLAIGRRATNTAFDGIIGEEIFYNRALNSAEILQVITYLKNKWGIA